MWRLTNRAILFFASTAIVFLLVAGTARAQAGVTTHTGTLADGATFLIEIPANWNGTLFLYSHGYVVPGSSNPAQDVGDPVTRFFMLSSGYALAGSSYAKGSARIALAGARGNLPGWFTPLSPEPAPTDFAGQEMNQFLWQQQVGFPFVFAFAQNSRRALRAMPPGTRVWITGNN
jgi:hypothetical protein